MTNRLLEVNNGMGWVYSAVSKNFEPILKL